MTTTPSEKESHPLDKILDDLKNRLIGDRLKDFIEEELIYDEAFIKMVMGDSLYDKGINVYFSQDGSGLKIDDYQTDVHKCFSWDQIFENVVEIEYQPSNLENIIQGMRSMLTRLEDLHNSTK